MNRQIIDELARLDALRLPFQQTFLAQMFLVMRDYLRDSKVKTIVPLEDWTLEDVLKVLPKEAAQ